MSRARAAHKIRGFQLVVRPTKTSYGITLEETNGNAASTLAVAKIDEHQTRAVLPAVMTAVKASGHGRTVLGPQRKAPIPLSEEAGVRLALALLATAPVAKARRINTMLGGVDDMATEEAYYWYAKCMGSDAGRARKALRIFLAEE